MSSNTLELGTLRMALTCDRLNAMYTVIEISQFVVWVVWFSSLRPNLMVRDYESEFRCHVRGLTITSYSRSKLNLSCSKINESYSVVLQFIIIKHRWVSAAVRSHGTRPARQIYSVISYIWMLLLFICRLPIRYKSWCDVIITFTLIQNVIVILQSMVQ